MTTAIHEKSLISQTSYHQVQRDKKAPASHDEMDILKKVGIVAAVIFFGSILLWAIGASTDVAALEIIGKVFFGLSISVIGIALIAIAALAWQCCKQQ